MDQPDKLAAAERFPTHRAASFVAQLAERRVPLALLAGQRSIMGRLHQLPTCATPEEEIAQLRENLR